MIHTSHRGELLIAYDRNSPRHNWNIIVSDYPENVERVKRVAGNWSEIAKQWGKAPQYQQTLAIMDITDGIIPDNLPKNHKFTTTL